MRQVPAPGGPGSASRVVPGGRSGCSTSRTARRPSGGPIGSATTRTAAKAPPSEAVRMSGSSGLRIRSSGSGIPGAPGRPAQVPR